MPKKIDPVLTIVNIKMGLGVEIKDGVVVTKTYTLSSPEIIKQVRDYLKERYNASYLLSISKENIHDLF